MVLENLQRYYKDNLIIGKSDVPEEYYWYSFDNGTMVGIKRTALSEHDKSLLALFLTPITYVQSRLSHSEQIWDDILFNASPPSSILSDVKHVQFLYFHITQPSIDPTDFKEAISGLIPSQLTILWTSPYEGIIIIQNSEERLDNFAIQQMIQTLMADFYSRITLFVGKRRDSLVTIKDAYVWEKNCFHAAYPYLKKDDVIYLEDAIPFLYFHDSYQLTNEISQNILEDIDPDLIETIKVYIECNLNNTKAAQKLYIHRNSLQYRIDKFINKTGIDVKQMKGAFAVYLAILGKMTT
ncbi:helix-turn-helix domain-containing protein [Bacillus tianshenii]|nr:helix-turn-helix domain-containing protein [Bacillus tianshenii]